MERQRRQQNLQGYGASRSHIPALPHLFRSDLLHLPGRRAIGMKKDLAQMKEGSFHIHHFFYSNFTGPLFQALCLQARMQSL